VEERNPAKRRVFFFAGSAEPCPAATAFEEFGWAGRSGCLNEGALRRAGWETGLPRQPDTGWSERMEKKKPRNTGNGKGKEQEKENGGMAEAGLGGPKQGDVPPKKKLSPRARVKQAQMTVLDKLNEIVEGNCNSAVKGNYKCAEFMLDWSGVTDMRTPLAKAKKKSLIAELVRNAKARKKAEAASKVEAK
jgi:hypothetical protein